MFTTPGQYSRYPVKCWHGHKYTNGNLMFRGTPKHEHTWILFTFADSISTCTVEKLKHTLSYYLQKDDRDLSLTLASSVEYCSLFNMGTNIDECVHYHIWEQITGQSYIQILKDAKSQKGWYNRKHSQVNEELVYSIWILEHSQIITCYCLLSLKVWHKYQYFSILIMLKNMFK